MQNAHWDFPKLNGGNIQGYTNSGIETFKGVELVDNLAREICQNSLDAKNSEINDPVIVKFKMQSVKQSDFPLFKEYSNCIKKCKDFWAKNPEKKVISFIERVEAVLAKDEINILTVSDYNTTGLTGSDAEENEKSVWSALVNADGVSAKTDNSAGGSYGIGKNAPFACSDISVVFYNTFANDDKKAFEGVARAATLYNEGNNATQGIGHYRSTKDYKPITSEMTCAFRDKFAREQYGTDIIIVGCEKLTEDDDWQNKLEQAVVKNFLLAIYENKLVVEIGDKIVNSKNIKNLIDRYRILNSNAVTQTIRFYDTITEPDGGVKKEKIFEDNDLEIYLKSDKNYKREIANFRNTGMLVGTNTRRKMQNFTAVVVIRGEKLSEILRATEPPKHNKWDHKLVEDKDESKKAKRCIDDINEKVNKLIDENYKIVTDDTVDADVGDYLPDEVYDLPNKSKKGGDDKLRPVQKVLGKPKIIDFPKDNHSEIAKQDIGEPVAGDEPDVRNKNTNPTPIPDSKIPKEVDPSKNGKEKGVSKGEGTKTYTTYPALNLQKIFAIKPSQGLYKLILNPIKDCEKIFVDFSAIGEGSSKDLLEVEKYSVNSRRFDGKGSKIGPIKISSSERNEIFVTFQNKEKMVINMDITEEVRR